MTDDPPQTPARRRAELVDAATRAILADMAAAGIAISDALAGSIRERVGVVVREAAVNRPSSGWLRRASAGDDQPRRHTPDSSPAQGPVRVE